MNLFNLKKYDKLIDLLKRSQQDFGFDQNKIKFSLINQINSSHLNIKQKKRFTEIVQARNIFAHRLTYVFASLILFVALGSTFAFADGAVPGDKLFVIDQLQEKVMLNLPLPQETKAQIRTNIVAERAKELNKISNTADQDEVKVEAIETSEKSLTTAIEQISQNREQFKQRGNAKAVKNMDNILDRLEQLAEEQENKAGRIHENLKDKKLRDKVELKLHDIRKARLKAHRETNNDAQDQNEINIELNVN